MQLCICTCFTISNDIILGTAVAAGTSDSAGTKAGGVIAGITAAIITLAIVC